MKDVESSLEGKEGVVERRAEGLGDSRHRGRSCLQGSRGSITSTYPRGRKDVERLVVS